MEAGRSVSVEVLEERIRGIRDDVVELIRVQRANAKRLDELEDFAQAYLATQRDNRRQEERQYRRMAQAIALGGVGMSLAMVALTVATLIVHG